MANNKKLRRGIVFLVLIAALVGAGLSHSVSRAQTVTQRVLILNSYHLGLSWTDHLVDGIYSVILDPEQNSYAGNMEIYVEYMDTKRFPADSGYLVELAELYSRKYADMHFDVIITSDNNAFNFLKEYKEQIFPLFPDTPVVFSGVNFFEDEDLAGEDTFTGVVEAVDMRGTLDAALMLHPDTRQIVVISDATTTGNAVFEVFNEEVRPEYEDRVRFIIYDNPDPLELESELSDMPETSLVFLILFNRDNLGAFYSYEESVTLIDTFTDRPIYGVWDFYLGYGMIGGMLTNGFSQGSAAAQLAVEILEGTNVQDVPIVRESPNRYIFDFQELQQFDIRLSQLPEGSLVVNRPQTLFERYQEVVWGAGIGLVVLGAVIVAQRLSLRRRQQIEADLRRTNLAFEEAQESLERRVAERTADLARRSEQLQIASMVARDVAAIRDVSRLMDTIVYTISEQFGFYHAGIFLIDEHGEFAVLRAASSEGGKNMLARKHKLRVGQEGIIGYVTSRGASRIASDVGEDAYYFNSPDLPETRAEMGLPLKVGNQVIGALDVQSTESQAFTEEDVAVLQTMADQLALAIENARLFEKSRKTLARLEEFYGAQVQFNWQEREKSRAYHYNGLEVFPLSRDASEQSEMHEDEEGRLVVPIQLRDEVIGTILLEREAGDEQRSWSGEELALARAVGVQAGLALENARLLEETRRRAAREQQIGSATTRMRESLDMESVLKNAADEIYKALNLDELVIRLTAEGLERANGGDNG